ncbi:MAG: phage tail protein [Bradymonadia bacterium]
MRRSRRSRGGSGASAGNSSAPTRNPALVSVQSRPMGKFRFKFEVDGITMAHFQSVTGLGHEIEVLEQQEGGVNEYMHKLPGQGRYSNLVLKVGWVSTQLVEDWHMGFARNPKGVQRKTGALVLLDDAGQEAKRWDFKGAWPVKWEGPAPDTSQSAIAVESIEIAYEQLT